MKKSISVLLCMILIAGILSGCGYGGTGPAEEQKLSIVATIFPVYDWVRQILGNEADTADVTQLLDSRVDLHSYQPTAEDMVKIANCDLFLYVGGESDDWVEDALREAGNDTVIGSICWTPSATPRRWRRSWRAWKQTRIRRARPNTMNTSGFP